MNPGIRSRGPYLAWTGRASWRWCSRWVCAPAGGYRVHIDRVTAQDGTLTVHAREIRPAATKFVTDALTQPFIAIATPACPGTVEHHITVTERG